MRSTAQKHWIGGSPQVNWGTEVLEETLMWISSSVLRPSLYSPFGLIALLGLIIQTWMNTKRSFSVFPLCVNLTLSTCFLTSTFYALTHLTLWFSSLSEAFSFPSLLTQTTCLSFKRGEKETDWPLQGPKAWGNPSRIVGLLCPASQDIP